MTKIELQKYVNEQKRQGRSESEIARSLGMSLAHLMGMLNGIDVNKVDPPKHKTETLKPEKKQEVKPVSGAKQSEKLIDIPKAEEKAEEPKEEKKAEDLSWMND